MPASTVLQAAAPSASAWLVVVLASFALPVIYMLWVRNLERHRREPLHAVLRTFLGGAILSVILGVIFTLLLLLVFGAITPIYVFLSNRGFADPQAIILALIAAPLAEEASKGLATRSARRRMHEREDGLVYGAAAGLGFSATENLLYGAVGLLYGGLAESLLVIALRSVSSSLLHGSASAVLGYGIAKHYLPPQTSVLPYYLAAVVMHSIFNFLASFGDLYQATYGEVSYLIGFASALVFALIAIGIVRGKIRAVDRTG